MWLLNADILAGNVVRQWLLIAASRDVGEQWQWIPDLSNEWHWGQRCLFVGNFMIYQDRIETSCLSFVLLFLKSTLLLNCSKHNWQALTRMGHQGRQRVSWEGPFMSNTACGPAIFLFFISLYCPQLFFCPPALPTFRRPCQYLYAVVFSTREYSVEISYQRLLCFCCCFFCWCHVINEHRKEVGDEKAWTQSLLPVNITLDIFPWTFFDYLNMLSYKIKKAFYSFFKKFF